MMDWTVWYLDADGNRESALVKDVPTIEAALHCITATLDKDRPGHRIVKIEMDEDTNL